jgi:hypothetical protein
VKQLHPPFFRHIIALLLILCIENPVSHGQCIIIDSTFTSDTELFPFNPNDTIYGLGLSGKITLYSDTSLVRLIFIDSDYNELLLYEAYPFICDSSGFVLSKVSDETKYLDQTIPHSLYVHVFDASIEMDSLNCAADPVDFADSLQFLYKQDIETKKIASINANIEKHEMIWYADETSVSHLSYAEKKAIFGDSYNMLGFEYYAGGIYDPIPGAGEKDTESTIVPKFDWRNRHGANDPDKDEYYYDDDSLGGGWLTAVQNQMDHPECKGLCYIYAPIATLEGLVNVYLNKHENFNLSEQHVLDCDAYTSNECTFGFASITELFMTNTGIVSDSSYPSPAPPGNCQPINNPEYHIRIPFGTIELGDTIDTVKESLILHGPHTVWMEEYTTVNHFMSLVGYGILQIGDIVHGVNSGQNDTVKEGDNYEGTLYWIYKNSYGVGWGDNGYMYHAEDQWIPQYCTYYNMPFEDLVSYNTYEIGCYDKDKDGYYNWGISAEKPITCPSCPDNKDSDDSDPRLGPFDDNYFGIPVKAEMTVHKNPFIEIPNGGFYTFDTLGSPETFEIIVKNPGDAQLNFVPDGFPTVYGKVSLAGPDSSHFSYNTDLDTFVEMNDGADTFSIDYDGLCTGAATCIVTIHLNEPDMDDFVFAIVFANCGQTPTNITISDTETWSDWRVISDNYKIAHGGKLTITGHVGFTDQVDFVVDKGGELIIDGGSLINACSSTWNGIDVWGDANLSQYPSSNQGCLKIINGGCIENADAAVQLTKIVNGVSQSAKNGGILRCDSAFFKNNKADVIFYSYDNFDPNTLANRPNRSCFYNTQFINDQIYTKDSCVFLQNVDGIIFKGCTFKNAVDKSSCQSTFSKEKGILSFNSGFYIQDQCLDNNIPCGKSRPCTFDNLEYGIYALNAEFNEIISVDTAIFHNTYRGIYMNLVSYPEITRNRFTYDEEYEPLAVYTESYGLDLEHCRNFLVEENQFINSSGAANMLGLQVLNAGPFAHEIYNNSFSGFYTGITAAGENRDKFGTGLCIKCNDFTNCTNDIHVTDEGGLTGYYGIAFKQGEVAPEPQGQEDPDPTYAAGNTFTEMGGDYTNYTNLLSCYSIEYTYHGSVGNPNIKVEPDPTSPEQPIQHINLEEDVHVEYISKLIVCPSDLGTGIDITSETNMMASESSMLSAYEDTLSLFVDGGDTEALNQDVQLSFPDEALEIRQELLNSSPYLSDTVMKSSIAKENVLPNVMIRDVLVANPQSAKSPSVMQSLDDRFIPVPEYMMNEIMMGQYTYGHKELLEQKLSKHKRSRDLAFAKLMRHYHSDTINTATSSDSIIALLNDQDYLDACYQLSMLYLSKHDSANAFSTLNNIPIEFDLTSNEQSTWQLYSDLIDINWEIMNDTAALDSVHIAGLLDISGYQNTIPALYARNILINAGELYYNEPVFLPSVLKVTPIWQKQPNIKPGSILHVFPNPAHSYFIVEYSMESFHDNAYLVLTDIAGKHVKSIQFTCQQDQIFVPVDDLPDGIYIVQLLEGNNISQRKKIIISR